ncbi:hypothetical protein AXF42_Ash009754 [Apostasia shenzhenica]|uniref:Uncharacterized protein n=1 Tax=Apostasia shenzhenica TaxID=1088818 RepID=A0A2I0AX01_9ASPA|nr:hypothetical protein AXF42_Ash009754 [Apostasia shenzhenica]
MICLSVVVALPLSRQTPLPPAQIRCRRRTFAGCGDRWAAIAGPAYCVLKALWKWKSWRKKMVNGGGEGRGVPRTVQLLCVNAFLNSKNISSLEEEKEPGEETISLIHLERRQILLISKLPPQPIATSSNSIETVKHSHSRLTSDHDINSEVANENDNHEGE